MFLLRLVCKLYDPVFDDLCRHHFMTSVLPTQSFSSVIVYLVETTFSKGDKQVSVFIDLSDYSTLLNLNGVLPNTFTSISCMHLSQNNVISFLLVVSTSSSGFEFDDSAALNLFWFISFSFVLLQPLTPTLLEVNLAQSPYD